MDAMGAVNGGVVLLLALWVAVLVFDAILANGEG